MRRFVEGVDRGQTTLFPECLEDWIGEDNPVRVVDIFVEELDLAELGFGGVDPEATGRPSYHPSILLKLYIYNSVEQAYTRAELGLVSPGRVTNSVGNSSPRFQASTLESATFFASASDNFSRAI